MNGIRLGLCTLFAFCVLAHGVVEAWSGSILEIGAALLLLAWAIIFFLRGDLVIHWNDLLGPLVAFAAIGLGQFVFHATASSYLTRVELLKLTACLIVFFLSAQAFRERADLTRLAWFLILLCFAVSLLGIIQHFTSTGTVYWVRRVEGGGDPFGPYVNRNHFAGFVELTLPVSLALLVFRGVRRDLFPLTGLLAIVPVSALILSGSRGGIISFVFQIGVLGLLARNRKGPQGPRMGSLAIVALAAVALIVWIGTGKAIERFSELRPGEVQAARRISMLRDTLHVFLDHPVKGTGLGTLILVYPRYETAYDGKVVNHTHNDFAEALAETGLLGGLCGAAFLIILFREARKNFESDQGHFSRALHAGAIAAVSGLLLHSFVDYNLHIPSNTLLFLLQSYLVTSIPLPSSEAPAMQHRRRHRAHQPSEAAA
jgi:O-antigen ligase